MEQLRKTARYLAYVNLFSTPLLSIMSLSHSYPRMYDATGIGIWTLFNILLLEMTEKKKP